MATQRVFYFRAQYETGPGRFHVCEGMIRSTIDPFDDRFYSETKAHIAESMQPPRDPDSVTLMSLSPLAERQID